MCSVIVEKGGYRMAWVGYPQQDADKSIRPMAQAGFDEGYLESANISWEDNTRGQGPVGRAVRSCQMQVVQSIQLEQAFQPWRDEASKRGYAANIALPLLDRGSVLGVLTIYAAETNAFDQAEVALLREMSEDLAYGIATLRLRQQQQRSTEQLRKGLEGTVQSIAAMVDMRDPYTAGHQRRVADLAAAIASEMGLPAEQVHGIHLAATIHDLGKIQVPAEILSKPRRLTPVEYSLIKEHPSSGYDILKNIDFPWPIAQMVLQHHERLDGSGYPQGLKGEQILVEASIIAVADVVEAMSSHRPYRPGLGLDAALEEIRQGRGVHYPEAVVDACVRLMRERGYRFE
jgi:HD-GYP domain-containing protein (c-di-GMP phosphodiesterase class II)